MKIGVISDSHSRVDLAEHCIKKLKREGAKFLIHAGDIVKEDTLKLLQKCSLPYKAVLGNNDLNLVHVRDKYNLYTEPYSFNIKKLSVKLMHHPYYLNPDADLIIYGHTHYFEAQKTKRAFYLNPGEVCGRKKKLCECALIKISKSVFKVKKFTCKLDKLKWNEEVFIYE